jgi:hypothetical protein
VTIINQPNCSDETFEVDCNSDAARKAKYNNELLM